MDKAIENMPDDFEIKGFLKAHRAEVKNMCITEYNEEETMALFKKDWQEEGREEGYAEATRNVIRNMLLKGRPDEDIISIVECDNDMIDAVRRTITDKITH